MTSQAILQLPATHNTSLLWIQFWKDIKGSFPRLLQRLQNDFRKIHSHIPVISNSLENELQSSALTSSVGGSSTAERLLSLRNRSSPRKTVVGECDISSPVSWILDMVQSTKMNPRFEFALSSCATLSERTSDAFPYALHASTEANTIRLPWGDIEFITSVIWESI